MALSVSSNYDRFFNIGNSSGNFRAQRVGNPEPTLGHVCIYFCGSGTRPLVSYSLPRNRPLCLAFGIVRPPHILLVCHRIHVTKETGGPINESKPTPTTGNHDISPHFVDVIFIHQLRTHAMRIHVRMEGFATGSAEVATTAPAFQGSLAKTAKKVGTIIID